MFYLSFFRFESNVGIWSQTFITSTTTEITFFLISLSKLTTILKWNRMKWDVIFFIQTNYKFGTSSNDSFFLVLFCKFFSLFYSFSFSFDMNISGNKQWKEIEWIELNSRKYLTWKLLEIIIQTIWSQRIESSLYLNWKSPEAGNLHENIRATFYYLSSRSNQSNKFSEALDSKRPASFQRFF